MILNELFELVGKNHDSDEMWLKFINLNHWKSYYSQFEDDQENEYYHMTLTNITYALFNSELYSSIKENILNEYFKWNKDDSCEYTLDIVRQLIPSYSQMLIYPELATEANIHTLQQKITHEFKMCMRTQFHLFLEDYNFYLHYERVIDTWIFYTIKHIDNDLDKIHRMIDSEIKIKYKIKFITKEVLYDIILSHPYVKSINEIFDNVITIEYLNNYPTYNNISIYSRAIREYENRDINNPFKCIKVGDMLFLDSESKRAKYNYEYISWELVFLRYGIYVIQELIEKTACWTTFDRKVNIHNITFWK